MTREEISLKLAEMVSKIKVLDFSHHVDFSVAFYNMAKEEDAKICNEHHYYQHEHPRRLCPEVIAQEIRDSKIK